MTPTPQPLEDAINAAQQVALAGEHACVYGYGTVGAALPASQQGTALAARDVHRRRRDALTAALTKSGLTPVGPLPGYALPFAVDDAAGARRLARLLETRQGALYAELVAATTAVASSPGTADPSTAAEVATTGQQSVRRFAAEALVQTARTAVVWGGKPLAFPGLPDRAPTPGSTPTPTPS